VAPSGRFVYGSNRGHDSIVIFAIDAAGGTLSPSAGNRRRAPHRDTSASIPPARIFTRRIRQAIRWCCSGSTRPPAR
jgi:hypothetical protein